jgi:hypothetical protein
VDAPLHVSFTRGVPTTFLVGAVVEGLATAVIVIYGAHPAILLVMVPGIILTAIYGLRCRGTVLTVDSECIATRVERLSWPEVENIEVGGQHALVATGAGRRLAVPLASLDTPAQTILARVELEWGRPVPAPAATRALGLG